MMGRDRHSSLQWPWPSEVGDGGAGGVGVASGLVAGGGGAWVGVRFPSLWLPGVGVWLAGGAGDGVSVGPLVAVDAGSVGALVAVSTAVAVGVGWRPESEAPCWSVEVALGAAPDVALSEGPRVVSGLA